jgi:ABC-type Na+ efflux pump permease subunit
MAPIMSGHGEVLKFELPLVALPVMALGAVALALFAAAGMMIFAAFARTFKEGQALTTPFYLAFFVPALLLQSPDATLTPVTACIPVANVMMVFREAINGQFNLPLMGLTFLVEAITIFLCLRLAAAILRFEDVVLGSYEGNLVALARERLVGKKR